MFDYLLKLLALLVLLVSPSVCVAQCEYDNQGRPVSPKARQKAKADAPLLRAIRNGNKRTFDSLLARGADVNAADCESGTTALMEAVIDYRLEMLTTLLQRKAEVNAQNFSGFTALMYAVGYGRIDLVSELLAAGADVNIKIQNNGWTALSMAKQYSMSANQRELVKLLKEHGAVE
jgi:ankyrin repeat protein